MALNISRDVRHCPHDSETYRENYDRIFGNRKDDRTLDERVAANRKGIRRLKQLDWSDGSMTEGWE